MNNQVTLEQYLQFHRILTDGAFGTYFQSICEQDIFPEQANLDKPELVKQVHLEYLKSGSRLIRTNTFAANTDNISGGIQTVKMLCKSAVDIAKQAKEAFVQENQQNKKREEIFIAGDIGPISISSQDDRERIMEEYLQIADTFLENGVDAILFETFPSLDLIDQVIQEIRKKSDIFIWVSVSVNQTGYSQAGMSIPFLIKEMQENKLINAFGFNCGVGPGHMHRSLQMEKMEKRIKAMGKVFSVLPNASYPRIVRGQVVFTKNDSYFSDKLIEIAKMGASIIGGCCGTTPNTIAEVRRRLEEEPSLWEADAIGDYEKQEKLQSQISKPTERGQMLWFENPNPVNEKLIAVELSPPPSANDEKILEAAYLLRDMQVDVVTFPDSPSGRTRADSILMAAKIKAKTDLRVMPHICCRDKNAIAIRAQILGAHMSDIRDFLVITGDPIPTMARESVKSVFNFDAVGLMKIIDQVNQTEFEHASNLQRLCYGGAINQNKLNLESEIKRVQRKMEAGASYFLTQPIFTQEEANRIKEIKERTNARIFCGIMPLISKKNALFIQNEMSGMCVTDEIVGRYTSDMTRKEGEQVGILLAKEIMEMTKEFADGFYFSIPFNRVYLLEDILA